MMPARLPRSSDWNRASRSQMCARWLSSRRRKSRSNITIMVTHHSAIGTSLAPLAFVRRTPRARNGIPRNCS